MQLPSFARFVPLFASARLTVSRERLHHTAALAPPSHAAARSRHRTRMAGGALLALAMAIPGSGLAQSSSQPATQAEAPAQAPAQANAAAYYYHSPYRRDSTKPQTLPELELSFDYSYMHANLAQSQCGCFGMNGGSTQVVFPFNRILSLAMELTGERTSQASTSNGGLSLVAFTAGPRVSYRAKRGITPYAQATFGGAHGFGAMFPTSSGSLTDSASSLAMALGGGVEVTLSRHFAIRPVPADYFLTRLPNSYSNRQNNLRIESSVVLRIW